MSKSLDQLAKNLASGMSRRKAIWQFIAGLGVVSAFTGRKAYAVEGCSAYCDSQASVFYEQCIQASRHCRSGFCADYTLVHFGVNGSEILAPYVCVRVNVA